MPQIIDKVLNTIYDDAVQKPKSVEELIKIMFEVGMTVGEITKVIERTNLLDN
jgi:hypothetical protein